MRVAFVRGGGIGGISRVTELRSSALSESVAREFAGEVDRADLAKAAKAGAAGSPASRGRDLTLYEVVVDDGAAQTRATFDDDSLPDAVRRLIEWIDKRPERTHPDAP